VGYPPASLSWVQREIRTLFELRRPSFLGTYQTPLFAPFLGAARACLAKRRGSQVGANWPRDSVRGKSVMAYDVPSPEASGDVLRADGWLNTGTSVTVSARTSRDRTKKGSHHLQWSTPLAPGYGAHRAAATRSELWRWVRRPRAAGPATGGTPSTASGRSAAAFGCALAYRGHENNRKESWA